MNSPHSRTRYVLIGLSVIAGIYIIADHGEHLLPYLPFAFLLGCFFMHLFMHKNHGGHAGVDDRDRHEHAQPKS